MPQLLPFSSPFVFKKDYLEKSFIEVTAPTQEELLRCYEELQHAVRNEDMRVGHLMSFETKDIIRADGAGLRRLGYHNPREWQLYHFMEAIPRAYGWIFALYRTIALERIHAGQCERCHFSINVPIQDRSRKKFYRAHIRAWVVDYQKPENKPRIALVTIDLFEDWSFSEHPIRAVGEFGMTAFPGAMNDFNQEMKKKVSADFLSNPLYLGLQAAELLVIKYMHLGLTTVEIAEKMRTSTHNVNFYKRKIIQKCNAALGHLDDARQWVNYLSQAFILP
ncbi:MAG: hypothetical protein EPGJADBJ_04874 [Saprospiraceae bacterium]|nr:hypothetical protein [Saprospiraceae bacterium]